MSFVGVTLATTLAELGAILDERDLLLGGVHRNEDGWHAKVRQNSGPWSVSLFGVGETIAEAIENALAGRVVERELEPARHARVGAFFNIDTDE